MPQQIIIFDTDTLEKLEKFCAEENLEISEIVVKLVKNYLNELDKLDNLYKNL